MRERPGIYVAGASQAACFLHDPAGEVPPADIVDRAAAAGIDVRPREGAEP
jgi:hypothetical protein